MDMMLTMDLQAATIAHLSWKSKLTDFFYGVEKLTAADVPDHNTCDFGKWLNSRGRQDLAALADASRMDALHKDVHDSIKMLVNMPEEKRKAPEGKQALQAFKDKCDQFISLLENMEREIKRG
ncbi:CZB domain-containing protein [Candidatus Electronema sp. JC]|uniref:CZB domain-containing protein n=1 Tax=Candidatus Electronema sp. JC TaxID=3401570 RepID=UPI003AA8D996